MADLQDTETSGRIDIIIFPAGGKEVIGRIASYPANTGECLHRQGAGLCGAAPGARKAHEIHGALQRQGRRAVHDLDRLGRRD